MFERQGWVWLVIFIALFALGLLAALIGPRLFGKLAP